MNKERAQYLLDNRLSFGELKYSYVQKCQLSARTYPDGITSEEDAYIRRVWNVMQGNTCYMDALISISRGATAPTDAEVKAFKSLPAVARGEWPDPSCDVCTRPITPDQEIRDGICVSCKAKEVERLNKP